MMTRTLMAAALSLACAGAFAQTTAASTVQRDVNPQTRIENGLKDGKLSDAEQAQLNAAQNKVSRVLPAPARVLATRGRPLERCARVAAPRCPVGPITRNCSI